MALPNQGMDFTAFDALSAAEMDNLVENIESLEAGTGLADSAITTAKINDAAITPVKWTNPYKFHVYRNAAQNTSTGAFVKVDFDTEVFDSNNNFATGTYTIPVDGFYQFSARVDITVAGRGIIALYTNGAETHRGNDMEYTAARMGLTLNVFAQFTAGQTIDIYVFDNSGSALAVGAGQTYFSGYLVSQT